MLSICGRAFLASQPLSGYQSFQLTFHSFLEWIVAIAEQSRARLARKLAIDNVSAFHRHFRGAFAFVNCNTVGQLIIQALGCCVVLQKRKRKWLSAGQQRIRFGLDNVSIAGWAWAELRIQEHQHCTDNFPLFPKGKQELARLQCYIL